MKKLLVLFVSIIAARMAVADVAVELGNQVSPIIMDPVYGGGFVNGAQYDLVWSSVPPPVRPHPDYPWADTVPAPTLLNEPEEILLARELSDGPAGTLSSSVWFFGDADVWGHDINAGYLILRIYDVDHMDIGDWGLQYLIDDPMLMEFDPPNPATIYQADDILSSEILQIEEGYGVQIIPEPASAGLLCLVACSFWCVRRFFPAV